MARGSGGCRTVESPRRGRPSAYSCPGLACSLVEGERPVEEPDPSVDLTLVPGAPEIEEQGASAAPTSGLATASKAVEILAESHGYISPTALARRHVAMAFAAKNRVV